MSKGRHYVSCSVSLTDGDKKRLDRVAKQLAPLTASGEVPNRSEAVRLLLAAAPYLLSAVDAVEMADDLASAVSPAELFRMKWLVFCEHNRYKERLKNA